MCRRTDYQATTQMKGSVILHAFPWDREMLARAIPRLSSEPRVPARGLSERNSTAICLRQNTSSLIRIADSTRSGDKEARGRALSGRRKSCSRFLGRRLSWRPSAYRGSVVALGPLRRPSATLWL